MNILSYSPSIEVYAAVNKDGSVGYYDLTPDVVSAVVNRACDAPSTFTVRLQNVQNKYNGMFTPMDRIKVFCTKLERYPLITGYVTKVPKYTVYGADVTLQGSCSLYRLQQLYWDPNLWESAALLGYGGREDNWSSVVTNLLHNVAGYGEGQVMMGEMPQDVIDWAKEIYEAGKQQTAQLKAMVEEFNNILQTHGPKFATGGTQTSGGGFSLLGDGVNFDVKVGVFVNEWGPRIDRFIENYEGKAGKSSPVHGHGNVYAEAAWNGRMDPRWLPAIAVCETGLGTAPSYAGYPYNLYGWGCADSGETSVARSQDGYDSFIHFILDNAGTRENGWGGAKVLNEYTSLDELDAEYCSGSAGRIDWLKSEMGSI